MNTKTRANKELGGNSVTTILRVDISHLTPKIFFEKYRRTGTPVIITGLLQLERNWDLAYLEEQFGQQEVLIRNYGRSRYQQEQHKWKTIGSGVELQSMPFSQYAEMLRTHQAHENNICLGKYPLKRTPIVDIDGLKTVGEKLGFTKPISDFNLYLAPGGHHSGLHYDSVDGTLMQLHGRKKLVLFPPDQTYNLYPFPVYSHLRHGLKLRCWFSQVSPEQPDLQAFPKFQQAVQHRSEVILHPGEVLFIPAGWWHDVTALGNETVCAVNRFWRIYPTQRAVFAWSRWRAVLGNICALPYLSWQLLLTLLSKNRKQQLSHMSHRV